MFLKYKVMIPEALGKLIRKNRGSDKLEPLHPILRAGYPQLGPKLPSFYI